MFRLSLELEYEDMKMEMLSSMKMASISLLMKTDEKGKVIIDENGLDIDVKKMRTLLK